MLNLKHGCSIAFAVCGIASATLVVAAKQPGNTAQQPKKGAAPAASSAAPMAAGVYSDAQATRGDAIYAENCAQCHTPTLESGDLAPALTGPAFVARWTAGRALSDLFDYMRTQMPLNSPGGLTAQHNVDLLAFLLKKAGYPAGKVDLPASSEKLSGVKVVR